MKKVIFFTAFCICFISCFKKKPQETNIDLKMGLLEADRSFAKMSEDKGMRMAFIEYLDSNGVLLRPNAMPILGGEAINYLSQVNDTSFSMTWEPKGASVAQSGDLGYTYGIYSLKPHNKDTVLYGTYVSVWKKQPDGKWKFILDSGNEGIGNVDMGNE